MKKININLSLRVLVTLFLSTVGFISCDPLIDDFQTDFGKGPVLAQFEKTKDELNIIKDANGTPIDYEISVTYFGGKGIALDKDVNITIATSSQSEAKEGVEFELTTNKLTIPAGQTTAKLPIKVLTANLVPFDFKDIVLEITESSESISEKNTIALTLKALGANTLAGTYDVVDGQYWNSGSYRGDYNGRTVVIEAISPGVYKHVGLAFWAKNAFYFEVDEDTGKITVLDKDLDGKPVLLNGSPIMTCTGGAGSFEMIPCNSETNLSILKDDGKHEVRLNVGYFRGTGKTREFFEKLIRK